MPTYYILLQDQIATEINDNGIYVHKNKRNHVQALKGSLWKSDEDYGIYEAASRHLYLRAVGVKGIQSLECNTNGVSRLTRTECDLLVSITTNADRYKVFQDKSWLSDALQIKTGSIVYVLNLDISTEKVVGKVRYKGNVPDQEGVLFGVELSVEYAGRGTTDGVFRKHRFFQCDVDCGVFVAINKLRICNKTNLYNGRSARKDSPVNSPVEHEVGFDDRSLSPPPIEIGERVVWLDDQGESHFGTVHWLGIIDETRDKEWTVGVEFDEPIGTGTGRYNDTQLFKTRQKHASLVPLIGLIKASEFGEPVPEIGSINGSRDYIDEEYMMQYGNGLGKATADYGTDSYKSPRGKKDGKSSKPVLDEAYYRFSYKTDRVSTPDVPPRSRVPQEKSHYEEISPADYENAVAHAQMSRVSSTHEGFLDDPAYARVQDWTRTVHPHSTNSPLPSPSVLSSPQRNSQFSPTGSRGNSEVIYAQIHKDSSEADTKNYRDTYRTNQHHSSDSRPPDYNELQFDGDYLDSKDQGVYSRTKLTSPKTEAPSYSSVVGANIGNDSVSKHKTYQQQQQRLNRQSNPPTMHEDTSPSAVGSPKYDDGYATKPRSGAINKYDDQGYTQNQTGSKLQDDYGGGYSQGHNTAKKPEMAAIAVEPRTLGSDLDIGSMVEVIDNPPNCRYGVIRWVGYLQDKSNPIVGLEMEEENSACTYGNFGSQKIFDCPVKKAFFVYLHKVKKDSRFEESTSLVGRRDSMAFGSLESPDVTEMTPPRQYITDVKPYLGKLKGIQGHHNSCYLDATLFSMFAFSGIFDSILLRDPTPLDIKEFKDVQLIMREGIVYPLRCNFYVRADKVLKLRTLLDKITDIAGLMTEEKDPEEFLNCLFQQVLRVEPYLHLNSNQESYLYQLFVEKDEKIILPTTEQLLELSFYQSNIKLREVPSCLILQMPRFGKDYKMYKKILPSPSLDITDLLEYGPRECHSCGKLARYECSDCFELTPQERGLYKCAFCDACVRQYHQHVRRQHHLYKPLEKNEGYENYVLSMEKQGHVLTSEPMPREKMELFAVICIETSHYVAFVKCGSGERAPWVFFDSMADREGAQNGYNIPEVKQCRFLPDLLLNDNEYIKLLNTEDDKQLNPYMRRLLCDAYICMYQSTDLQMYT